MLALVLITFSFRKPDDGPVASAQSTAAAVLRPFTIAGRARRPAVSRRLRVGRLAPHRPLGREEAPRGERGAAPAGDPEPVRRERERQAQGAARVPRRPALPERLHRPRRRGDRAPDRRVRAGRRRRGRLERRRRARRPGRHRGRVPRPRDARLLALGAGDAAHRRAARRLGARRQVGRRRHRQARPRIRLDAHLRPRPEEAEGLGRRHDRHRRLALEQARLPLSARDPDRAGDERRAGRHRPVEAGAGGAVRRLRPRRRGPRARPQGRAARERRDGVADRADRVRRRDPAGVGVLGDHDRRRRPGRAARHPRLDRPAPRRRSPEPSPASSPGCIVDVATLGTLGLTSLLLTLAGLLGRPLRRDHGPRPRRTRRSSRRSPRPCSSRSAATCSTPCSARPSPCGGAPRAARRR